MAEQNGRPLRPNGRRSRWRGRDRLGRLWRARDVRRGNGWDHRLQTDRRPDAGSSCRHNPSTRCAPAPRGGKAAVMKWLSLFVLGALLTASPNAIAAEAPSHFALRDVPKPLSEIAIADGAGKIGALADFRGKFVLLNIWATWCVPCRKGMPTLDPFEGQLGGPDFEVVALSIDRGGADAVRKFYSEVAIQHLAIHFDAAAETPFKLSALGLPTTLLIDRRGQEIARLIRPPQRDSPALLALL